ncbi:MAG: PAS domain S-box protein [Actinobacteria bacterium]|nr:PAS domain S-box protein [Actinomycetota bacterium]MCB8996584.1 PAS domain S-box protein [Actinomycetota bacterium]MCB9415027.1 PAS domain S-box protein [Actinomycetota bacterium]
MQEDLYMTVLETIEDGVYFVDPKRRITFWNDGAATITGYEAAEVMDHSCAEGILRHVNDDGDDLCLHGCPPVGRDERRPTPRGQRIPAPQTRTPHTCQCEGSADQRAPGRHHRICRGVHTAPVHSLR